MPGNLFILCYSFLLECNSFTMLHQFLPYNKVNQLYEYVYPFHTEKHTDLTEAEDIKKMWQQYTEELYKTIFMT